jgi:flagellar protein FlaG
MNVSLTGTAAIPLAKPGLSVSISGVQAPVASVESKTPSETVSSSKSLVPGKVADQLEDAVSAINAFLKPISNNLEFSIDEASGKTVVKLVDMETKTVLRQYPTKEALAIAKDIDRFQGLLINTEA